MVGRTRVIVAVAAALIAAALPARAQGPGGTAASVRPPDPRDAMLKQVRLEQKLNGQLPLDTEFRDETGRRVRLADYFREHPVMLMLIQYRCTMLCTEQIKVLLENLKQLRFTPGREFQLLIVSIDPRETPELAAEVKQTFMQRYGRPQAAPGVHFLTGDKTAIDRLAGAIGFHYAYDPKSDQFAHPDGVMIATPHGVLARYFFRLEYPAQGLRFGLIEAASNRIGTPLDALALLCFHYNPTTGKYALAVLNVVRLAGIGTVLLMALGVLVLRRRERPGRPAALDAGSSPDV